MPIHCGYRAAHRTVRDSKIMYFESPTVWQTALPTTDGNETRRLFGWAVTELHYITLLFKVYLHQICMVRKKHNRRWAGGGYTTWQSVEIYAGLVWVWILEDIASTKNGLEHNYCCRCLSSRWPWYCQMLEFWRFGMGFHQPHCDSLALAWRSCGLVG